MSFNLRYYFSVSDNKQRNYNSMSGPPSKFVVVIANTFTGCNWIERLLLDLSLKSVTIFSCIVDLSKSSDSADKNSLHLVISECECWVQLECQDGIETSSQSVMQQTGSP